MLTCKDCAHVDVCRIFGIDPCPHFVDRSRFVELPCKIGDVVYCCLNLPKKRRVTRIVITQYGVRMTVDDMFSFDISQIGKTVFLTREEAETAMKERENSV